MNFISFCYLNVVKRVNIFFIHPVFYIIKFVTSENLPNHFASDEQEMSGGGEEVDEKRKEKETGKVKGQKRNRKNNNNKGKKKTRRRWRR